MDNIIESVKMVVGATVGLAAGVGVGILIAPLLTAAAAATTGAATTTLFVAPAAVAGPAAVATAGSSLSFVAGISGGVVGASAGAHVGLSANGEAANGLSKMLLVGASEESATVGYTFDCWKPVIHDTSPEPSSGRLLGEITADPRVKEVIERDVGSLFPEIILENVWDEKFLLEYVLLPTGELAAHAVPLTP